MSETVDHFVFNYPRRVTLPFKDENKTASAIMVEYKHRWSGISHRYMWDVYRFLNATSGEWLTACVGHSDYEDSPCSVHIVRGQAYPDASYVPEN